MDYRALLAVASAAAGAVLAAIAIVRARRQTKKPVVLWVYALLFVVAGFVLWHEHSLREQQLAAQAQPPAPEVLLLPEPEDSIAVQRMQTPTVPRRKHTRSSAAGRADSLPPEEQLYRALSRVFDVIEEYAYRQGKPGAAPDSLSARRPGGPVEFEIPFQDSRAPHRKAPA